MKSWIYSKTIWINAIALGAMIIQTQYGYVVEPGVQATMLILINLILRKITKEEIVWNTL